MQRGRLLVTGCSGLVGHAVMAAARSVFECIGTDSRVTCESDSGVVVDLRDRAAVLSLVGREKPTHIVHSAAISHPSLAGADPLTTIDINVTGTANLLEAARQTGIARFVFVSSAAVYEGYPAEAIVDETARLEPCSIYGASKVAAEALVWSYSRAHGMSITILRPCSIYGLRRAAYSLPAHLISSAIDRLPVTIADAGHAIDFMHIDDAARAVMCVLDSAQSAGNAYNIATGERSTYAAVAHFVSEIEPGADVQLVRGNADLGAEPRLNVEKAKRDLRFTCQISLRQGLSALAKELAASPDARRRACAAAPRPVHTQGPVVASPR